MRDMEHRVRVCDMQSFSPVSQNRVQVTFCLNEFLPVRVLNKARRGMLNRLHAGRRSELRSVACQTYRFI